MTTHRAIVATIAIGMPLVFGSAHAADLQVFSSNALKSVIEELGPQYEKATENKLVINWKPAAVLKGEIEKGAAFDVAAVPSARSSHCGSAVAVGRPFCALSGPAGAASSTAAAIAAPRRSAKVATHRGAWTSIPRS